MMKEMMKYIWPKGELSLKARVVFAIGLLVGAKVGGKGEGGYQH